MVPTAISTKQGGSTSDGNTLEVNGTEKIGPLLLTRVVTFLPYVMKISTFMRNRKILEMLYFPVHRVYACLQGQRQRRIQLLQD